jgi:tetratricopeptide (TPR) repeat protein
MKTILRLLMPALLLFLIVLHASATDRDDLFFQANQAYKNGNYQEAAQRYKELTASGSVSGHVFYNLGNAYFRLGDLGRSLLNYERARLLIPRDADLAFNLGYARDRMCDAVEPPARPLGAVFFWLDSFSLNELFVCFAILNILFFASLVLRLVLRCEWTFTLMVTVLVIWLVAGPSLGVKWYQGAYDNRAVIIAGEAAVLAGPDARDTELFKLHAGTMVISERMESGWVLVRISDEKRGWVQEASLGLLRS